MKLLLMVCTLHILLAINHFSYAQMLSINYQQDQFYDEKEYSITRASYLTEDSLFYYEVLPDKWNAARISICKFEKGSRKKIWQKIFPISTYNRKINLMFCDLERVDNGFIVFLKKEDKATKESLLTAMYCDDNFTITSQEKVIERARLINQGQSQFVFEIIRRGNNFFTYGVYKPIIPNLSYMIYNKNQAFTVTKFNEKLEIEGRNSISFPQEHYYDLKKISLVDDENLAAIFSVSKDNQTSANCVTAKQYFELVKLSVQSSSSQRIKFNMDSYFGLGSNFSFNINVKDQTASISGAYNKNEKNDMLQGVFNFTVELASFKLNKPLVVPFTEPLIKLILEIDKVGKSLGLPSTPNQKGEIPFINYLLKGYYAHLDNTHTFIIEEFFGDVPQGKVFLFNTNDDGQVIWHKKIYDIGNYDRVYISKMNDYIILLNNVTSDSKSNFSKKRDVQLDNFYKVNVLQAFCFNSKGQLIQQTEFRPEKSIKSTTCDLGLIKQGDDEKLSLIFVSHNENKPDVLIITPAILQME